MEKLIAQYTLLKAWLCKPCHKKVAQEWSQEVRRAFTQHPHDAGESYWQHLWFTSGMALRIVYTSVVLMIHGLFPFLLTRAASRQVESIYGIMKTRIPKARRDEIDLDYSV